MKTSLRFLLAILLCLLLPPRAMAQEPTPGDEAYYIITFKSGYAIEAGATGAQLTTKPASSAYAPLDKQAWKLVGTDAKFQLLNRAGQYAIVQGANVMAGSTADTYGWTIDKNQLKWLGTSRGASCYMNQHGGAGVNKNIALYSAEENNKVSFTREIAFGPEQYFLLRFDNSGLLITAGANNAALTVQQTSVFAATDKQKWAFEGNGASFQLKNKAGQYAVYNTSAQRIQAQAGPDAHGWMLSGKQIQWKGSNTVSGADRTYVNQFQGGRAGNPLALWSSETNNNITLIDADDMPEYHIQGATSATEIGRLHPMTLWYAAPAVYAGVADPWMEYALPIGNGELGACLFGNVKRDEIQFNEKTLWQGAVKDMGNHGGYKNGGSIFVDDLSGTFQSTEAQGVKAYYRSLDIHHGVGRVHYASPDGLTTYDRTYIASNPDRVVAVHYTAQGTGKLSLRFSLTPGEDIGAGKPAYAAIDGHNAARISCQGGDGVLRTNRWGLSIRVEAKDGTVAATSRGIEVTDATDITLYLAADTNFDPHSSRRDDGRTAAQVQAAQTAVTDAAAAKGFEQIYADHIQDFTQWTSRVTLDINAASNRNTEELVKYYATLTNYNNVEARFLEQLYFCYGRYLAISSNRVKPVPNNLQGIWNHRANAPWNSDIHTNINIQMNYWPAEITNLSELHTPLLEYIIKNAADDNWKACAKRVGIDKGWSVFTESNLYGGMSTWGSNYFVANAWYCSHLWQHYRYTLDRDFLLRAFPAMWSAAEFWMERMISDRGFDSSTQRPAYNNGPAYKFEPDGTFVAPDEYSAEQNANAKEDATAHAQQLIYALLTSVKESVDILGQQACGLTDSDMDRLQLYLEKTDQGLHTETYTANTARNSAWTNQRNGVKKGDILLREWKYSPYDISDDPAHRHMSHLMALYPLSQIDPSSPYFKPAVNSLKLRGDKATGWSMGWKVNLWARALDGDHAHTIINTALRHSTTYGTNQAAGGIYYNLYDSHAPFQIDGNFGVCSGIAEMLLQSHSDTLQLLPALPTAWAAQGSISGLRAVGNFSVDQQWAAGKLTRATITSHSGRACPVIYAGIGSRKVIDTATGQEVPVTRKDDNRIVIPQSQPGAQFAILMDEEGTATAIGQTRMQPLQAQRSGDTITVAGQDVAQIQAFDTAGKLLAIERGGQSLRVRPGVMLLKVTDQAGRTQTIKMN